MVDAITAPVEEPSLASIRAGGRPDPVLENVTQRGSRLLSPVSNHLTKDKNSKLTTCLHAGSDIS